MNQKSGRSLLITADDDSQQSNTRRVRHNHRTKHRKITSSRESSHDEELNSGQFDSFSVKPKKQHQTTGKKPPASSRSHSKLLEADAQNYSTEKKNHRKVYTQHQFESNENYPLDELEETFDKKIAPMDTSSHASKVIRPQVYFSATKSSGWLIRSKQMTPAGYSNNKPGTSVYTTGEQWNTSHVNYSVASTRQRGPSFTDLLINKHGLRAPSRSKDVHELQGPLKYVKMTNHNQIPTKQEQPEHRPVQKVLNPVVRQEIAIITAEPVIQKQKHDVTVTVTSHTQEQSFKVYKPKPIEEATSHAALQKPSKKHIKQTSSLNLPPTDRQLPVPQPNSKKQDHSVRDMSAHMAISSDEDTQNISISQSNHMSHLSTMHNLNLQTHKSELDTSKHSQYLENPGHTKPSLRLKPQKQHIIQRGYAKQGKGQDSEPDLYSSVAQVASTVTQAITDAAVSGVSFIIAGATSNKTPDSAEAVPHHSQPVNKAAAVPLLDFGELAAQPRNSVQKQIFNLNYERLSERNHPPLDKPKKSTKKVHKELLILMGLVTEPTACFFYPQVQTIRDRYFEIPTEFILNYFVQLQTVLLEDPVDPVEPIALQVRKMVKLLNKLHAQESKVVSQRSSGDEVFSKPQHLKVKSISSPKANPKNQLKTETPPQSFKSYQQSLDEDKAKKSYTEESVRQTIPNNTTTAVVKQQPVQLSKQPPSKKYLIPDQDQSPVKQDIEQTPQFINLGKPPTKSLKLQQRREFTTPDQFEGSFALPTSSLAQAQPSATPEATVLKQSVIMSDHDDSLLQSSRLSSGYPFVGNGHVVIRSGEIEQIRNQIDSQIDTQKQRQDFAAACRDCAARMRPKFEELKSKPVSELVDVDDLFDKYLAAKLPDSDRADFIELKYLKALEIQRRLAAKHQSNRKVSKESLPSAQDRQRSSESIPRSQKPVIAPPPASQMRSSVTHNMMERPSSSQKLLYSDEAISQMESGEYNPPEIGGRKQNVSVLLKPRKNSESGAGDQTADSSKKSIFNKKRDRSQGSVTSTSSQPRNSTAMRLIRSAKQIHNEKHQD